VPFCAYCGSQVPETSYRPCPACGNPANGAPKPALGTGGSSSMVIAIVAAVLAVLAIPIAGILAAIAIPNFLTAMQRSKQKRTMADIRMLAQDVEQRAGTAGSYPQTLDAKQQDGWGTALRYECLGEEEKPCAGYAISSAGKDLRFEHDSAGEYSEGATAKFDCDIVWANGSFLQYPEGAQR
jgi:type II secretory pathway pseudopilin PulG